MRTATVAAAAAAVITAGVTAAGVTAAGVTVAGVTVAGVTAANVTPAQASAADASTSHAPTKTQRFTVVEHADTDTVVDNAPHGDSIGDTLAFGNPLFDRSNTRGVGRDLGSCARTTVGAAYQCSWTVVLHGGSLVVQGPFYDTHDSVLAITGGTGRWSTTRGQMRLHARNTAGTAYDFTFAVQP